MGGGGGRVKMLNVGCVGLTFFDFFSTLVPLQQIGAVCSWIFVYFRISNGINKQNFLKKSAMNFIAAILEVPALVLLFSLTM